jgi:hypothetical protein
MISFLSTISSGLASTRRLFPNKGPRSKYLIVRSAARDCLSVPSGFACGCLR